MSNLEQPVHYKKLHHRKSNSKQDASEWNETFRAASSDHGLISQPIISHLMQIYGISREKAVEIAKLRAQQVNREDNSLGEDTGSHQQ